MHDHDHEHGNVLTGIGLALLVVSLSELSLGGLFGAGPVVADGAEKLSDGVIALLSGSMLDRAEERWSNRHWVRHNLRRATNAAIYGLAILLVGLFGLYESAFGEHNGGVQMIIGSASFVVILALAAWLRHHARHERDPSRRATYTANAVHLWQDSYASAGIVIAGALGLVAWPRLWNVAISLAILAWICIHNLPHMKQLIRDMHREVNCDEPAPRGHHHD